MRTFLIAALLLGCGAKPPPKTERLETELSACNKNLDAIQARIRSLLAEKIKVNQNRDNLPADYDKSSIDQTMDQIDSELTMRQASATNMAERCEAIDLKLHKARMAQPL